MSITVNGADGATFGNQSQSASLYGFVETYYLLKFSGSYPAGGDTLDFSNGGVNSAVPSARKLEFLHICPCPTPTNAATALSSTGGRYFPLLVGGLPGITGNKLKIWTAAGAEYTTGAYGTDVTLDAVYVRALWRKG